ncbi:MAG: ligase-associated DNA damage response endonuclease PdeM [Akkermansiaceae bacterium]|nr:ligase-associated DNA damage response endonuclease PdeM [Akkermansiaceae bacterium]
MLITHQGHQIELLSEHAVYLPAHSALVLSDVHLGKAATFQAHGLPVPAGDDEADLARISKLIEKTGAQKLIIAGDLLHSPHGVSPALINHLETWMSQCSARITLILGNHDRRALRAHPMESVPFLDFDGLRIIHDPAHASTGFSICGHLHPVIRVKDSPRSHLRTACFWLSESSLILPSFGTFTGGQPIKPISPDRIFAPLNGRVVELPVACWK